MARIAFLHILGNLPSETLSKQLGIAIADSNSGNDVPWDDVRETIRPQLPHLLLQFTRPEDVVGTIRPRNAIFATHEGNIEHAEFIDLNDAREAASASKRDYARLHAAQVIVALTSPLPLSTVDGTEARQVILFPSGVEAIPDEVRASAMALVTSDHVDDGRTRSLVPQAPQA